MKPRSDAEGVAAIVRQLRSAKGRRLTRTEILRRVFGAGISAEELGRVIDLGVRRGELELVEGEKIVIQKRTVTWITLPR
jgi:hypothetical protein